MKTDLEKLKVIQSFITENYVELETSRMLHKTVKNKAACLFCEVPLIDDSNIEIDSSWQEEVFHIIDNKNMNDPDVYKKAFITKQTFSKIRKDVNYHPDKDTAIKMCVGLELDEENTLKLLEKAGYTLSNAIKKDIVIRYFIRKKEFDIISINNALYDLNLNIPIFGMVKNDKHQTRALMDENRNELTISQSLLNAITMFQDSVHDTAIGYHRKLRDESMIKSALDEIPGIGTAKKAMLLKKFGSVEKISEASIEELTSVKGINEDLAKKILEKISK